MGLPLIRSLMGQSHLLCNAHLLETGLSLIRSLMGQPHLLLNAHLLRPYVSLLDRLKVPTRSELSRKCCVHIGHNGEDK